MLGAGDLRSSVPQRELWAMSGAERKENGKCVADSQFENQKKIDFQYVGTYVHENVTNER